MDLKLTNQVPIVAGHEFLISTDKKDAENGTADMIYMDYVSYHYRVRRTWLTCRPTSPKSPLPARPSLSMTVSSPSKSSPSKAPRSE